LSAALLFPTKDLFGPRLALLESLIIASVSSIYDCP